MAILDPDYDSKSHGASLLGAPRALVLILGAAFCLFIAVACGSLISDYAPLTSPWLFAGAFAAPATVVFTLYWLLVRYL